MNDDLFALAGSAYHRQRADINAGLSPVCSPLASEYVAELERWAAVAERRWKSGAVQPDEVREDGAGVWRDESGLQSVAVSPSLAGAVASVQFTPARPARRRRWWHRKQ